jgi:hypothetical protein
MVAELALQAADFCLTRIYGICVAHEVCEEISENGVSHASGTVGSTDHGDGRWRKETLQRPNVPSMRRTYERRSFGASVERWKLNSHGGLQRASSGGRALSAVARSMRASRSAGYGRGHLNAARATAP